MGRKNLFKMKNINDEYQEIIKKCKFISKPNEWFIEGEEVKYSGCNYLDYKRGSKFNNGCSLFEGYTNETFKGYSGELPRPDGDTCSFEEFFIYDEFGNEISELTLEEYTSLLRENCLKLLLTKKCCDNGIIDCPECKDEDERSRIKYICAGCHGSGKVTCGKCGGNNKK